MQNLNIVYDPKAKKQLLEIDEAVQAQIKRDLAAYIADILQNEGKWLDFWAVQSDPYRLLIRTERDRGRVLVMDISRKRFT